MYKDSKKKVYKDSKKRVYKDSKKRINRNYISSNLFKLRKLSNSDSEGTPKVEINFDLLF